MLTVLLYYGGLSSLFSQVDNNYDDINNCNQVTVQAISFTILQEGFEVGIPCCTVEEFQDLEILNNWSDAKL